MPTDRDGMTFDRRTALKLSAAGLALGTVPVGSAAADSSLPDTSSVTPEDEASALDFAESFLKLDTKEQASTAWQKLSDRQAKAVTDAIQNNIEIRHQRSLNQGLTTDDVTTQGIPATYTDKTQHIVATAIIYELEHTIEWEASPGRNTYSRVRRSSNVRTPPPFWESSGVIRSNLQRADSFFNSYVEAEINHTQPLGGKYYPYIELQGRANGTGRTLKSNNNF